MEVTANVRGGSRDEVDAGEAVEIDALGDTGAGDEWFKVQSLDLEGQGVARSVDGKVVFIDGALPGEEVQVRIERSKNNWARGTITALRRESAQRVVPACPHFGVCGGCKLQHFDVAAQLAVKQRAMEDALWHLGKVTPAVVLRPIAGPAWGYRHRARLSVFYLARERRMLIGFHGRKSSHVSDIGVCPVMPPAMSELLGPLHELIMSMNQRDRLPQIEVAVGSDCTALVLRHLKTLGRGDLARLRSFEKKHGVQWWLQPAGPETAHRLESVREPEGDTSAAVQSRPSAGFASECSSVPPSQSPSFELFYELPEFGIRMPYRPTDFTQVNPDVNRVLVRLAMQRLDATPDERVIDWFCGMGNFTLPIARTAGVVLGVEGSATLVAQAKSNAALHSLASTTQFKLANLFEIDAAGLAGFGRADKWLIDPPRDGAFALVKALVALHDDPAQAPGYVMPTRIVYVSCDPSTLARDAGLLVHQAGYRCSAAGVVNMFPHTGHVESIAVFDRQ